MAYRSESSNSTEAHPLAITAPAGIQNGDVLIIFVATDAFGPNSPFTWPSGFTEFAGSPLYTEGLDASDFAAAWKVASGESGSYSVSNANARTMIGGMLCFSGRSSSVPQAVSANAVQGADPTPWDIPATSITPTAGCDLIFLGNSDNKPGVNVTHAAPATYTLVHDLVGAGSTLFNCMSAYKENVSAGATGTVTGTGTGAASAADTAAFLISLAASEGGATLALMGQASF